MATPVAQPTAEQQLAAQRAGQGPPPPPPPGGGLGAEAAAAVALALTAKAAANALAAPATTAPALVTQAITAAAAGILGSFDAFQADRREDLADHVTDLVDAEVPDLEEQERLAIVAEEMDFEKSYAAKARQRLARDLPRALSIEDADQRRLAVQMLLDRERRFAEMREDAVAVRALGRAEKALVKVRSPQGAFWRLSPHVETHTLDCLAMGGKAWPWSVLDTYHPPLHVGCSCELIPIPQAIEEGLMRAGDIRTADQGWNERFAEAPVDVDDEDFDLDLLEAAWERRWGAGTTKAGQFRPKRGGDPGAVLRRRRRNRMPTLHTPSQVAAQQVQRVKAIGDHADVGDLRVDELREGDRILVNGELERIIRVRSAEGLVELERTGLVHIDRATIRGVASGGPRPQRVRVRGADVQVGDTLHLPEFDRDEGFMLHTDAGVPITRPWVVTERRVDQVGLQVVVKSPDYGRERKTLGLDEEYEITRAPDQAGAHHGLPELPKPADGDRYELRWGDNASLVMWDRDERRAFATWDGEWDLDEVTQTLNEKNAEHRASLRSSEPAPTQPGGGPSHEDVLKVARMRRPSDGGELLAGFHYDPDISRSEARGDDLYLPPGFFKQSRQVREKVLFRHLGGRLADELGPEGLRALHEQDDTLRSRKAIVDGFYALNSDNRDQFSALRPDAARLVATAAVERGIPIHPDAAKLARNPAAADASGPEHPAHHLAGRLVGLRDAEAVSALNEAGYTLTGMLGGDDVVYRNHAAGATITTTLDTRTMSVVEKVDVTVNPELDRDTQVSMAHAVGDEGLDAYMNGQGFGPSTRVGDYLEFVHPDGRGVAWPVDGPQYGKPRTFTPTSSEIQDARKAVFARDPLSQIKAGDEFRAIRDALDTPWGDWRMDKSAAAGETVEGAKVELPEGTIGFATFGRGERAITVQYADQDGTWRVTRAGLADPDPAHPGRIVTPAEHAATLQRINDEKRRKEEEQRAAAAAATDRLSEVIRTGDTDALKAALAGKSPNDAVAFLKAQGLDLRARRRSRKDGAPRITYTLRSPGGETVKISGPLSFAARSVDEVKIETNPQGGQRTRLPAGIAPKNLDELLVDVLGRADELGGRFDAGVNVSAVIQGGVMRGAAAHHEFNGTIAIGKTTQAKRMRDYLAKRKKGERLSEYDHLAFYDDLETLQHEVNHGVAKAGDARGGGGLSFGPQHYRGLGKNIEEALTEESAHLLTVDWLRSYGMTDVLAALKRNPESSEAKGVYREYRVQLRALLDDAGVPESERAGLLLRMKFEMTPEERNAELIRLSGADNLGTALHGIGSREEAERRRNMRHNFEPILRPDLSDIEADPVVKTTEGRKVLVGASVTVDQSEGPRLAGRVVALRADGYVKVAFEDGTELWIAVDRIH